MKKSILANDLRKLLEFGVAIRDKSVIVDALTKYATWLNMHIPETQKVSLLKNLVRYKLSDTLSAYEVITFGFAKR